MAPLREVPDWVLEEGGFDYSKLPGAITQDVLVPVQEALAAVCFAHTGLAPAAPPCEKGAKPRGKRPRKV